MPETQRQKIARIEEENDKLNDINVERTGYLGGKLTLKDRLEHAQDYNLKIRFYKIIHNTKQQFTNENDVSNILEEITNLNKQLKKRNDKQKKRPFTKTDIWRLNLDFSRPLTRDLKYIKYEGTDYESVPEIYTLYFKNVYESIIHEKMKVAGNFVCKDVSSIIKSYLL